MERIYIKGFVDIKGGDVYHLTFNWNIGGRWADGFKQIKMGCTIKKRGNLGF